MKILNAIHAQNIGGVDQVFRDYTEILTENNHDVALLISANGNENYDADKIFKLRNFSQISDLLHLSIILIKFKPDLVICHSVRVIKWMSILKTLPFFSDIKSIALNHGISFRNSLRCDYVISINQQIHELVVSSGFDRTKSFVLPNAIKIDQKYLEKNLSEIPVIGIYGRIEERKGFDILIKAAKILAQNNQNFRLKIGGFDVLKNYNQQYLKDLALSLDILDKCDFVGVVKDKKSFFSNVDILCVPSLEEPFGLVILEGFLFSTLVVSSDTDGGNFLIKDGETGFLFERGNCNNLAEKLSDILRGSQSYGEITRQAFIRLEREFSFSSLSKRFEEIIAKISK